LKQKDGHLGKKNLIVILFQKNWKRARKKELLGKKKDSCSFLLKIVQTKTFFLFFLQTIEDGKEIKKKT
jgi:hypothetical protein